MTPALLPGDGLIATPHWPVRAGQIRCLPDPRDSERWLVKRVAAVDGSGAMRVLSDNRSLPTADSRSFGPVATAGSYRVLLRIPARFL
jgi:hypothetical protein